MILKNKIFIILLFVVNLIYSQELHNNSSKKWEISEFKINDIRSEDEEGTCIYEIEFTFYNTGKFKKSAPCYSSDIWGTYKLLGSQLIINTDTFNISELSTHVLKTNRTSVVNIGDKQQTIKTETIFNTK